jgi:hypothetical protein
MPISWLLAFTTLAAVLMVAAAIRGCTIGQLLHTDTLWPLAIVLPALAFGKVLGLISMNLIGYLTPLRRVFEQECCDTGRHDFATATFRLARVALVLFVLTVVGAAVFLLFSR